MFFRWHPILLSLLFCFCSTATAATVSGNLQKWSPLTISFSGPNANETDNSPNPFLDYRLTVELTSPSGKTTTLPGFFAGDGFANASGNQWQARFSADEAGTWRYQAWLHAGSNIAVNLDLSAGERVNLDAASGEFVIQPHSANAPGFERFGRLEYTGEHYLKFRDGPYWIKGGTDSPENFLGYEGFDGTIDKGGENFIHHFNTHRQDASSDDPFFTSSNSGKDSMGITGAINYLSNQGVNSIYFLPMNLGGDGQETYPFVAGEKTSFNKTHYDISKLYQWNLVLEHAQKRGIALNIVLSETEPANERWLDNGQLGTERKLFFRELVARFGYLLAAKWNLGEENDYSVAQLREQASYLKQLDWSQKPIAVHTQINNFRDYEQLVGDSLFSATSIQYDPPFAADFVKQWRTRSADAGRKWVIDMDENTGGISDKNADVRRKQILYDVYFSGGNLEWYYGYHPLPLGGDLTAGDFRKREAMWKMMRYARQFVEQNLPFWRMQDADNLVSNANNAYGGAEVFAAPGEYYAVYLPSASGNPQLDLSGYANSYSLRWFNPRTGEFEGSTVNVNGGQRVALGNAPSSTNDDWVVLLKSHNAASLPDFAAEALQSSSVNNQTDTQQNQGSQSDVDQTNNDDTGNTQSNTDTETTTDNEAEQASVQNDASSNSTEVSPNQFPYFLPTQVPNALPGYAYNLSIIATDPDGVAPVITANTLPAGMQIQVSDGLAELSWSVPAAQRDTVSFELIAIDVADSSMQVKQMISIAITAEQNNQTTEQTQNTTEDAQNSAEKNQNSEADTQNTTAQNENSSIQTQTTSSENTSTGKTIFSVSDALAILAGENLPPAIFGAKDTKVAVGETLQMPVIPVDPEGIVASVRIAEAPAGSEFRDNGNGTRTLIWTPTQAQLGKTILRFIATDEGEIAHVVQTVVTVDVVANQESVSNDAQTTNNLAPVFVPVEVPALTVGDSVSINIKSIDPDGKPPILHLNQPPAGASFNDNGDGTRTFIWTATEDYTGTVHLDFTATDSDDYGLTVNHRVSFEVNPQ